MSPANQAGVKAEIAFTINGETKKVFAYPMARLLDVLRNEMQLTGTKEGCGEGECGSCSVLLDGLLVNSCLIPVGQVQDANMVTIEGISKRDVAPFVQQAFLECGGAQCGICTPGMILAAVHLLEKNSDPTLEEIREGLAGNLCRCTGYTQIFAAVAMAARRAVAK